MQFLYFITLDLPDQQWKAHSPEQVGELFRKSFAVRGAEFGEKPGDAICKVETVCAGPGGLADAKALEGWAAVDLPPESARVPLTGEYENWGKRALYVVVSFAVGFLSALSLCSRLKL